MKKSDKKLFLIARYLKSAGFEKSTKEILKITKRPLPNDLLNDLPKIYKKWKIKKKSKKSFLNFSNFVSPREKNEKWKNSLKDIKITKNRKNAEKKPEGKR